MTILAVVLEEVARRSGNPLCGNCGAFFFRSAPAPAVRPLGARSRRLLCVCLSCFGVALARRALPSARGSRLRRVPSPRGNIGAPPPVAPFCNAACGGAAPLFILTRHKKKWRLYLKEPQSRAKTSAYKKGASGRRAGTPVPLSESVSARLQPLRTFFRQTVPL